METPSFIVQHITLLLSSVNVTAWFVCVCSVDISSLLFAEGRRAESFARQVVLPQIPHMDSGLEPQLCVAEMPRRRRQQLLKLLPCTRRSCLHSATTRKLRGESGPSILRFPSIVLQGICDSSSHFIDTTTLKSLTRKSPQHPTTTGENSLRSFCKESAIQAAISSIYLTAVADKITRDRFFSALIESKGRQRP